MEFINLNMRFTLQKKLSISFVVLTLVATGILSYFLYIKFYSELHEEIKQRIFSTVSLVALQIDAEKHNSLLTSEDEKGNTYFSLRQKLQKARDVGHNIRYVYTMRMNKDKNIMFVVDAEEEEPEEIAHLGDIYDDASKLLKSKFSTMSSPIVEKDFYTDKWGTWITAYAPFYTADGKRAGVLGMDISADSIKKQERKFLFICLSVFIFTAIPASIIGWFLGYKLMLPLAALKKRVTDVSMDNLEQRLNINKNNEIGELISSFDNMAAKLNQSINKLKDSNIEIENAHKHAIYMLAVASEYKDEYTGNHVKHISQITTELAEGVGIEARLAEKMGYDSVLHDLGKIGISDTILLKPGKLTNEEFEIVKQHTIIGAKIIGNDEWFHQARQIAMSHHERWDGNGYPKKLKGDDIPFAARIVAVVDVFHALISKRPYKEPWSLEKTVEEIKHESGKHFDPKVVKAFLALHEKGKLEKYIS
jgi:HD-GYP domain-containing protein (c-di-GMP phosphodiesterase class II)